MSARGERFTLSGSGERLVEEFGERKWGPSIASALFFGEVKMSLSCGIDERRGDPEFGILTEDEELVEQDPVPPTKNNKNEIRFFCFLFYGRHLPI